MCWFRAQIDESSCGFPNDALRDQTRRSGQQSKVRKQARLPYHFCPDFRSDPVRRNPPQCIGQVLLPPVSEDAPCNYAIPDEQARPHCPSPMALRRVALAAHDRQRLSAGSIKQPIQCGEIVGMVERDFGSPAEHIASLPVKDASPLRPALNLVGIERLVPGPRRRANVDDLRDAPPLQFANKLGKGSRRIANRKKHNNSSGLTPVKPNFWATQGTPQNG